MSELPIIGTKLLVSAFVSFGYEPNETLNSLSERKCFREPLPHPEQAFFLGTRRRLLGTYRPASRHFSFDGCEDDPPTFKASKAITVWQFRKTPHGKIFEVLPEDTCYLTALKENS